jgi:type IV pilus assembly protein PilC
MTLFTIRAKRENGDLFTEDKESADKFTLFHDLKQEGVTVLSAEEKKISKGINVDWMFAFMRGVKMQDKILFARNLGAMIDAGLSMSRALAILERQNKSIKLKDILSSLSEGVKKGDTLSSSMKKFPDVFSDLFVAMVAAGEESGKLADTLKEVSGQMEKTYSLQRKVKGALIYPGVIISAMVLIGILMMIFVIPSMTKTFKDMGVKLPLMTRVIVAASDFMSAHYILVFAGLIGTVFAVMSWLKTPSGKRTMDSFVLHIPIITPLVKETNAARTARTLSSLLASGVPITEAIGITKEVMQNSHYKKVLEDAGIAIQKGEPLSKVFLAANHLYPDFVGEMMAVGEETGKVSDMFMKVATFYEEEVDQKTKDMSTIIEPFLMVFIGASVGFFAIAMISPTYSLVGVIN